MLWGAQVGHNIGTLSNKQHDHNIHVLNIGTLSNKQHVITSHMM